MAAYPLRVWTEVEELAKKRLFCVLYVSIVLFMFAASVYLFWAAENHSTDYDPIVVSDIVLSSDELSLSLDCTNSSEFFRWYKYDIVNHTLYLTVCHGPSLFRFKPWPAQVYIRDESLSNVHSVYLRDGKSARLVHIGLPAKGDAYFAEGGTA